ncbi:hypothetical protein BCR32DRAFT_268667 [Anaeromyces robustus]|uniref:Uncharacterized protein n=1 Tax=Anaeromyces robustus TaxID=1754192 RepID=A0A1Y1X4Q8_9FUNG|nr:hypothetical protein BCR32DRAFT_268667 [Anaeromyces robustus]|eukprot:ORX80797.1 hypothetical protein BCR32DRAFT_268667 [Anaeromyces robustus]
MNNGNSTTIDPLSFFTFSDAVNYFHELQCNSNKDCPLESDCIGHKCILPFYCNDDQKCAFYETLCDGKPCLKQPEFKCQSNSDCLSGTCNKESLCEDNSEYYSGTFSLEDGSNYIKQYINQCRDKECSEKKIGLCKGQINRCVEELYCKDPSTCTLLGFGNVREGLPYDRDLNCRTDDECLSGVCSTSAGGVCKDTGEAAITADLKDKSEYGMYNGGKCTRDEDCYADGQCLVGKCYSAGRKTPVLFILICVLVVILAALALCCCRRRRRRNEKN